MTVELNSIDLVERLNEIDNVLRYGSVPVAGYARRHKEALDSLDSLLAEIRLAKREARDQQLDIAHARCG